MNNKIKFGFINYKPFTYKSETQEYKGYSVELFKKICNVSEIEFEFIEYEDFGSLLDDLREEKIDIVDLGFSDERKELYKFSDSFIKEEMRFVFHKNEKFIDNIVNNKIKIGSLENDIYHQELMKKYGSNLHVELYKSYDDLHKAFLDQKIDLFL
jgi:ABC-type amino acid transport substrate-binding protein